MSADEVVISVSSQSNVDVLENHLDIKVSVSEFLIYSFNCLNCSQFFLFELPSLLCSWLFVFVFQLPLLVVLINDLGLDVVTITQHLVLDHIESGLHLNCLLQRLERSGNQGTKQESYLVLENERTEVLEYFVAVLNDHLVQSHSHVDLLPDTNVVKEVGSHLDVETWFGCGFATHAKEASPFGLFQIVVFELF